MNPELSYNYLEKYTIILNSQIPNNLIIRNFKVILTKNQPGVYCAIL